ncbi:MAG TPA: type IV secretory system conjugative DNA transfer family protein, partial [Candidatus Saccharimonadales bacterium]|nr:type IV secretory system conjugative DNA transfer family protein [Candidatus Saccharimonadales bacterium]
FWNVEFATWNDKFAAEAVAPVLNKVGAFTASPLVRNIIGQPKSSFNIRHIMDERKILIVNLSRGQVGEDNAALLGALLVTKIQLASMSRADVEANERVPFYLYVDEFQNFATDSFATILSEARKYALNLTVANQYIAQMSQDVKDAVFGNVGSMIAFRMGADDARGMQRYFEPKFEEYDLVHMNNRNIVISMTIDGEKTPAFSATTLNLPEHPPEQTATIIEHSRANHAIQRAEAESYIHGHYGLDGKIASEQPKMTPKRHVRPEPKTPQAQAAPQPVKKPATDATAGMGSTAVASVVERVKLKRPRKRRRSKVKKPGESLARTNETTERTIFER